MDIQIRHIDRTCLNKEAFIRLIKKYSKKFKYDILIVFDLRIKDYGNYKFDSSKNSHNIKMSPSECGFTTDGVKLDNDAEKYNLITTILHELRHAQQYEEMGYKFWSTKFGCTSEIVHSSSAEYFSKCEIEAREYENRHILNAVNYYNRCTSAEEVV